MVQLAGQRRRPQHRHGDRGGRAGVRASSCRDIGVLPNVHFVYGNLSRAANRPAQALEQFKLEIGADRLTHVLASVQIAQELIKHGDFDGGDAVRREGREARAEELPARKVLGQVRLQSGRRSRRQSRNWKPRARSSRRVRASASSWRAPTSAQGGRADAKRERAEFQRLEALQQAQRGADRQP